MSVATRKWHRRLISEDELHFLRHTPIIQSTIAGGKRFWLAHASPTGELNRYMNADEVIAASVNIEADIILVGHTHLPFLRETNGRIFCNPGSVGMARDHGGEACYVVWENGRLVLKRTAYDVSATITRLEASPLNKKIVAALRDVLIKK
jgi:predicted phosphodiesterase